MNPPPLTTYRFWSADCTRPTAPFPGTDQLCNIFIMHKNEGIGAYPEFWAVRGRLPFRVPPRRIGISACCRHPQADAACRNLLALRHRHYRIRALHRRRIRVASPACYRHRLRIMPVDGLGGARHNGTRRWRFRLDLCLHFIYPPRLSPRAGAARVCVLPLI